jgi:hypothetical protein
MRWLLFVVACFFCSLIYANDYITVRGIGSTFEEAKKQAFRKAIEYKVGVTVLSDVETQNFTRVKNDIYLYSAGYVDDYKLIGYTNNNGYSVDMEVKVSISKLKNKILSVGQDIKEFDGDKHFTQTQTYIESREQGDKLLIKVLANFPEKAFSVYQNGYSVEINNRQTYLHIPYSLAWNINFLKQFRETLNLIQNDKKFYQQKTVGMLYIRANDTNSGCNQKPVFHLIAGATIVCELLNRDSSHYLNDYDRLDYINRSMTFGRKPNIAVTFKDTYNNTLYSGCYLNGYNFKTFYDVDLNKEMYFNGNMIENGTLIIPIHIDFLKNISKIELSVSAEMFCPK